VRVLARSSSRRDEIAPYVSRWHEGDVLDEVSLRRAAAGADAIFHLAARVDFRLDDPQGMWRVNVEGTENLIRAAEAAGAGRLVHVSTIGAVGAPTEPVPVDETFEWNLGPLAIPYFRTKREAEERALQSSRAGFPVVVVNPSITIAPPWSGRRPRAALARLLSGPALPFSIRTGLNLLDQRDAAVTIAAAARHGRPGERYLVTGENKSLDDLLALVETITGVRAPHRHVPRGALVAGAAVLEGAARVLGRTPRAHRSLARLAGFYWFYDAAKARRELGHTSRPLASTLEEIARAVRG
jgi:dihydroflavonol-4-reductase